MKRGQTAAKPEENEVSKNDLPDASKVVKRKKLKKFLNSQSSQFFFSSDKSHTGGCSNYYR